MYLPLSFKIGQFTLILQLSINTKSEILNENLLCCTFVRWKQQIPVWHPRIVIRLKFLFKILVNYYTCIIRVYLHNKNDTITNHTLSDFRGFGISIDYINTYIVHIYY